MRVQIIELQSRPLGTKTVEKIVEVEKIVYRDRPQQVESEEEKDVSINESIEETMEVVGRVKVAESSAGAFVNLERDD